MIQRIQTVLLLLISIASALSLFYLPPLDFPALGFPIPILLKSYLILTGLIYGLLNADDLNPFLFWLSMPFLVLILLILSNRAIQKDEDLIRSIDRLR